MGRQPRPHQGPASSGQDHVRRVSLTLEVTDELNGRLDALASDLGGSKSDLLRKAIALIDVALQARRTGRRIAVVDEHGTIVTRIVGL